MLRFGGQRGFHLVIRVKGHQGPRIKGPPPSSSSVVCMRRRAGRQYLVPGDRRKVSISSCKPSPVQLWSWHQCVPTCSSSTTSSLPAIVRPPPPWPVSSVCYLSCPRSRSDQSLCALTSAQRKKTGSGSGMTEAPWGRRADVRVWSFLLNWLSTKDPVRPLSPAAALLMSHV